MQELLDYAERHDARRKSRPGRRAPIASSITSTMTAFPTTPIPIKVAITVNGDGTLVVD